MSEELKDAKPGDVLAADYLFTGWREYTVERVTKTQIITDGGARWNRTTGRMVGAAGYNTPVLKVVTPEIKTRMRVQSARNVIGNIDRQALTDAEALAVADAIRAVIKRAE